MSAAARKLIYIVGLSHSGSTVLDMLLTTAGKAVGLGQVSTVLRETPSQRRGRLCSCGASAPGCEMWGPVLERLAELPGSTPLRDRYLLVLAQVARLYGSELAVVDSSKHAQYLGELVEMDPDLDIMVVHNMKDVRPFTISTLDNLERKGQHREVPEKIFYQWYRDNRRSYDLATRLIGRSPVRVMYEGVCLSTRSVAAHLAESLGENYVDADVPLNHGHTHIISGNRLRLLDSGKPKQLVYDYRWMARSEWLRPYALMPMVRRYNEQCLREFSTMA
jgi:hypothetical protein